MLSPIKGGDIYDQQWSLGEAAGIELFTKLPENIIAANTAKIKELQSVVEAEEDDAGRNDAG